MSSPAPVGASQPLFAEDLPVAEVVDLGTYVVSVDEIVDFALQWDPQPFHVDVAAASDGYFGEVIAAGVHAVAIFQRLAVIGAYRHWAVVAGRQVQLSMPAPLRPAVPVRGELAVREVVETHPDRSLVTVDGRLLQDGTDVLIARVDLYVRRRHVGEPMRQDKLSQT
ncbi:MaoC/PaaZ C-terminal domain-containing protein [Aeromicrobium sp.]|uniref:MaoC/PaaZ C-terminal domain-containing protein n=1 Tax=Aeromicrobium sp. TaxID=1871063 RepID=UPI0028A85197|nr:MaoC/PaaZ C-terminal domain-containing protein [Aeromicrobium sp.]